jgi:hypothetical protein
MAMGRRAGQIVRLAQTALLPLLDSSTRWTSRSGKKAGHAHGRELRQACQKCPAWLAKPSGGCESGRPGAASRLDQSLGEELANLLTLAQSAFPSLSGRLLSGAAAAVSGGAGSDSFVSSGGMPRRGAIGRLSHAHGARRVVTMDRGILLRLPSEYPRRKCHCD